MNPAPKAVVFHASGCGLANRLRALVGYQALARLLNVPFSLCWISDASCEARFEELFDTPIRHINPGDLEPVPVDAAVFRQAIWFDRIWEIAGASAFSWLDYLAEVCQCLRELRVQPELLRLVEDFSARHGLASALGVHIRNTDNLAFYDRWAEESDFDRQSVSLREGFLIQIREQISERPVFLSTDDAELEKTLKGKFPDLVTFPKQYLAAGVRTTPIAEALCEMALLGRCHRIVGTYYSSFSKFSAVWAGVDYYEVRGTECTRSSFVDRILRPSCR